MDNARPSLDLAKFDKICPDKNIKGTPKSNFLKGGCGHTGIFPVPVIAVFTKYDQLRRDALYRLEDQGLDTSTDPALLNANVEKIFKEQYLANLKGSPPFVCLESENLVDQLACATLIPVPQECTSPAESVLSLLKRLPMSSLAASLP